MTRTRKFVVCIVLVAMLPVLSACGGDDGAAPAPADTGGQSLGDAIFCVFLYILVNGECVEDPNNATPTEPPAEDDGDTGSNPGTSTIGSMSELEPNDTLGNAQPVVFPVPAPMDEYVAVKIYGTLNDLSDVVDSYILTVPASGDYRLSLCELETGCDQPRLMDVYAAFLRVMDQDGHVLFTSQADELGYNIVDMYLDAGVVYYLTVNAGDTLGVDLKYRLTISQLEN
jgi:hypothetical protein